MSNVFLPLWSAIQQVTSNIINFFTGIQDAVNQIVNTGQGIFAGLSSIGSFIWKAITDFGNWLYQGLLGFAEWIYNGVKWIADRIWEALQNAYNWLASGITWVGNQIYAFGNWLYNGIVWLWNTVVNIVVSAFNWIMERLKDIWEVLGSWYAGIVDYVNAWYSNLMVAFRRKLALMIMTDLSIYGIWKSMENMAQARSFEEIPLTFGKALAMPFLGYIMASIVESLVPVPSTKSIELVPKIPWGEFKYTPITISLPAEKPAPTTPAIPTLPSTFPPSYRPTNKVEGEVEGEARYIYPIFVGTKVEGVIEGKVEYRFVGVIYRSVEGEIEGEAKYSTSIADLTNPDDYAPPEGWDKKWSFISLSEIDDFANYSKAYTDIGVVDEARFMIFNPPDGEIGNARRKDDGYVLRRGAVAMKIALSTMEVATTICSIYTSDGSKYAYVSITTIEGNLSQLKLSEYTGNAQIFDIPTDGYIIVVADFVDMVARVYDKNGNILAEVTIGVGASDVKEGHIGVWEENISGHVVENIDVDWIALTYGVEIGTPKEHEATGEVLGEVEYELAVPTAVGTMVKKPTLISFGINI